MLNHVGGPLGIGAYAGRRDEVFAAWAASIRDAGGLPERLRQARRPGHARSTASASTSGRSRRPRRRSRPPGGPTSRPASRRSAPTAACSRATSRSTRARTATPSSGTPAKARAGRERDRADGALQRHRGALLPPRPARSLTPRRVTVIDSDPGTDDAIALFLALASPELECGWSPSPAAMSGCTTRCAMPAPWWG